MKKIFALLLLATSMFTAMQLSARTFQHPGVTYTKADILRMKAVIAAQTEPYYSTYQALASNGFVSRAASTSQITSITADDDYNNQLGLPGRCALDNALLYQLTGKEGYATKAIAWINDLSHITSLSGETMALSAGKVELLIEAAELMRDYTGWEAADKARFDAMLKNVFYPELKNFDRQRWGNQGLTAARAIIAMGVYLDNEGMYDHAYRYLTTQSRSAADTDNYPTGAPASTSRQSTSAYMYTYATPQSYSADEYFYDEALPYYIYKNGQCEESSRDQGHAQYGLNLYGNIAEIAWNQGDNLYGELSNRILLGFEWTYRYNLDTTWAPASYTTNENNVTFAGGEYLKKMTRSKRWYSLKPYDGDRGDDYSCGLNREMVLAHYAVRAERPATEYTYLQQSVDNMISKYKYEQGDVKAGGHYYEFPGWGTLTKHRSTWMVGDPVVGGEYAMHTTGETINFTDVDKYNAGNDGHSMKKATISGTTLSFSEQNGWASYTINVEKAQKYALKVAYTATADDELGIAYDGGSYTSLALASSATEATMNITLTKGVHVFRFRANAETPNVVLSTFTLEEVAPVAGAAKLEKYYRANGTNDDWTWLKIGDTNKTLNGMEPEALNATYYELKYNAGLFVIQKYEVADLDKASKLTIKMYKNDTKTTFGTIGLWSMADQKWQTSTSFSDVYPYVKAALGIDAHQTEGEYTAPLASGVKSSDGTYQEFTISGDALNTVLANAVKNDEGNYEISFIVTLANPIGTSSTFCNNSSVANEESVATCTATIYDPTHPVAEYNYRPNNADTKWGSSTPKEGSVSGNTTFEINSYSRFFAIEQIKVADFNKKQTISLKLTQSNTVTYEVGVWDYPYALTTSSSESNETMKANFLAVTGLDLNSSVPTGTLTAPIDKQKPSSGVLTFTIPASKVQPVSIDANGTATINILVATTTFGSNQKVTIYTNNEANDEDKRPVVSVIDGSTHPVKEYGYRPKASDTGYDAFNVGTSATSVEANYAARLFAIQQYEIPNYSKKQNITLTLTNSANGTELGVWDYPYNTEADLPSATSTSNETLIANLAKVTGYTPWNTTGTMIEPITTAAKSGSTYTLTIPASKLTPVGYNAEGDAIVNILITNTDMTNSNAKAKFYTFNTANTENQWPTIAIGAFPVYNNTTETGYADLAAAVAEAETEDELEINEDQTLSARLDIATDLTIKGATGEEKIIRAQNKDIITILNKANVTLENLTIDGLGVDRGRSAIESSTSGKTLTLKNVTIENFANTTATSGIIQLKNNGKMVAEGVTMTNCYAQDGYGCIFVGSNNALTLKGDNGTCGSIYNEKSYTIDATEATHTTPIIMNVGTVTEGNTIIKGSNDQSKYTLVNEDYKWMTVGSDLQIASPQVTLTVGDAGCATLVLPFDAELPVITESEESEENLFKAYTLTTDGTTISKEEVTAITANKPVYVESPAESLVFTASGKMVQTTNPTNGCLTGVYAETLATPDTYVLQKLNGVACFYQVAAGEEPTIGKNRAYLTATSGAKVLYFDDNTETGIESVGNEQVTSNSRVAYNLVGQRVAPTTKGIIIVNGKKHINK